MANRTIAAKDAEAACDRFNEAHATGETIRFWSGPRKGAPREGTIRYGACVMGGHTPVIYVVGVGAIALSHVEGFTP